MQNRHTAEIAGEGDTSSALPEYCKLAEEVQFWRGLIASLDEAAQSNERLERMQQALELAEFRLAAKAGVRSH